MTTIAIEAIKAGDKPNKIGELMPSTALPIYSVRELVTWYAMPRAISSTPSETINEGIRQPTEIRPVMEPHTAATSMPSRAELHTGQPQCTVASDSTEAAKAITEPTDKSMPPMIRTKVMPTAITTKVGISFDKVLRVARVKKFSLANENSTHIATSAPIRPA